MDVVDFRVEIDPSARVNISTTLICSSPKNLSLQAGELADSHLEPPTQGVLEVLHVHKTAHLQLNFPTTTCKRLH